MSDVAPYPIHVERLFSKALEEYEIEIAERKGLGHPDTLTDQSAEAASIALSEVYLKEFGRILHHNVDKGLLIGGRAEPEFGGGVVIDPIYIIIAGRATKEVQVSNKRYEINVEEIAREAVKRQIRETFRFLDPDKHVVIDIRVRPGSAALRGLFEVKEEIPYCNDTSIGAGFAPYTLLEKAVLGIETLLNSKRLKKKMPEVGEDVKVLGVRKGKSFTFTVASAMISSLIPDKNHYISVKEQLRDEIEDYLAKIITSDINVDINTADNYEKNLFYLTVTGTSAEAGDDGNAGRSNRVSGLITPMREYTLESASGKNPVSHTGKIYNVLSFLIANQIANEVKGVKEVYVRLVSNIGYPINRPLIASAAVITEPQANFSNIRREIESILKERIERIQEVTNLVIERKVRLF